MHHAESKLTAQLVFYPQEALNSNKSLWWSPSGNVGQWYTTHELHHNSSAGCGDEGGQ